MPCVIWVSVLMTLLAIARTKAAEPEAKTCARRAIREVMAVVQGTSQVDRNVEPVAQVESRRRNALAKIGESVREYSKDAWRTKGLRLFLKDVQANDPDRRYFGLLTEAPEGNHWYQLPRRLVQYLPRKVTAKKFGRSYDLTPMGALGYQTVTRPVRAVTRTLFKKEKDLTLLVMLPAYAYVGGLANKAWNEGFDAADTAKLKREIEGHAVEYDSLIQNDYRFSVVKEDLESGEVTPKEARQAAFVRLRAINNYYAYMAEQYDQDGPDNARPKLLAHPLFAHLRNVVENGVTGEPEGYLTSEKTPRGPVPAQTVDALLAANHLYFVKCQIIPELVGQTARLKELRENLDWNALVETIRDEPFSQRLFELNRQGKLSREQLIYRLEEDAFQQTRIEERVLLGLVKLKKENGRFTSEPITLEDLRQETLDEIERSPDLR